MIGNQNRFYFLGGYNISDFVLGSTMPNAVQKKPEWGEMPDVPRLEVELINLSGLFSSGNISSMFYNINLTNIPFEVKTIQGANILTEWSGFIENIQEDYAKKTVQLTSMSRFSKVLDQPALVTLGTATPAQLSRDVFRLFSVPVNETAYNRAISLHTGLVTAMVDPNLLESQITLFELQKQLAIAGYGRIYPLNGEMVYEVFEQVTHGTLLTVGERQLMDYPQITSEDREARPYTVESLGGQATSTSWVEGGQANTLDFGTNAVVKITSLTAAQQVADQWERIDGIRTKRIEFAVLDKIGSQLGLDSYVRFNWENGYFSSDNLEIVGIDRTDRRFTKLTGRAVVNA